MEIRRGCVGIRLNPTIGAITLIAYRRTPPPTSLRSRARPGFENTTTTSRELQNSCTPKMELCYMEQTQIPNICGEYTSPSDDSCSLRSTHFFPTYTESDGQVEWSRKKLIRLDHVALAGSEALAASSPTLNSVSACRIPGIAFRRLPSLACPPRICHARGSRSHPRFGETRDRPGVRYG